MNSTLSAFPRDATGRILLPQKTLDRFWRKVNRPKDPDACWEWTASRIGGGYGHFGIRSALVLAHRLSFLIANGDIPDGLEVRHTCDNPPCVRPDHLILGTRLDNMRDKVERGRARTINATPKPKWVPQKEPLEQLFWRQTDRSGDCWLWLGSKEGHGYGYIRRSGKYIKAHRLSYTLFKGPIPDGKLIRHTCHNRACVNPAHLLVGTHMDNREDMLRAGRARPATGIRTGAYTHPERRPRGDRHKSRTKPESVCRGERHGRAKLTEVDARKILNDHSQGISCYRLAKIYGLHSTTIEHIVNGKAWKHIPR